MKTRLRSIKKHIKAQKVNMGGIILDQALPVRGIDQIDPFLLVHHWSDTLKGGKKQQDVGVGPHPHRGFAPVTFIFEGGVHHRDSEGHNSVIQKGGTQWMNSGKGIVHSERPTHELAQNGGDFEIIQFWVNAPSENKMDKPSYQPLSAEDTPWIEADNGKVRIGLIAGEMNGVKSKISTYSPLFITRLELASQGQVTVPVPDRYNGFIYVLDGELEVNEQATIMDKNLIQFEDNGIGDVHIKAKRDTRAILLSGQPIGEKVATYGPFVMNTQEEIMQAIQDYQSGEMGVLVENFD